MGSIRLWTREHALMNVPIPRGDELAFVRLYRLLENGMPLVLSDGKECLYVQEERSAPAWIWTANDISDERLQELLEVLCAQREQGYLASVIVKNRLARLLQLVFPDELAPRQQIEIYRMRVLVPHTAAGKDVRGKSVSAEDAGALIGLFTNEDGSAISTAEARHMGEVFVESETSHAWLTPDGTLAAIAKRADVGARYSDVHTVITRPDLRRNGFASALLSVLCEAILAEGRTPMLYAEAENDAATSVYRSLGFEPKARLSRLTFAVPGKFHKSLL